MNNNKTIIIIAGPTASGKSEIAIELAKKINGIIINADSSQVYKEAPILTNSPTINEQKNIAHYLYNFIDLEYPFKVTEWVTLAHNIIKEAICNKKVPIIVGGNGFYINILINGITNIPESTEENKFKAVQKLKDLGLIKFREFLYTIDSEYAKNFSDPYRLLKSYSIYLETGKPLSEWQKEPKTNQLKERYILVKVLPDRIELYNKINNRFEAMIKKGALEEAKQIFESKINPATYKKVIGLNELISYLTNNITLEDALYISQQKTRNYAKRQFTWFKNQLNHDIIINKIEINLYKLITAKIISN